MLLGIVIGCVVAAAMGKMTFDKVGKAHWFDVVTPLAFGMPSFDVVMILTMALANVDFKSNRNNLYIVAISIGAGMIPLVAPRWTQQMAHGLHPLLESGILLTSISAVLLNMYFNGSRADEGAAIEAAKAAEAH